MRSPTVWELVGARFSAAPTEARTGRTAWEWCGARLTFHDSSEVEDAHAPTHRDVITRKHPVCE